jgi:hypothetical protein
LQVCTPCLAFDTVLSPLLASNLLEGCLVTPEWFLKSRSCSFFKFWEGCSPLPYYSRRLMYQSRWKKPLETEQTNIEPDEGSSPQWVWGS